MTAALTTPPVIPPVIPPVTSVTAVLRPAPRREPPFDDELVAPTPLFGHEQRLPFTAPGAHVAWAVRPSRPSDLPDPAPWGRRFVLGLIETSAGRRPLAQLAGMLSPSVHRGLAESFERAGAPNAAHWLQRASVRSVRASEPREGVAELCATVETGRRVRAIAFRLEEHRGRWRCVRLQLG